MIQPWSWNVFLFNTHLPCHTNDSSLKMVMPCTCTQPSVSLARDLSTRLLDGYFLKWTGKFSILAKRPWQPCMSSGSTWTQHGLLTSLSSRNEEEEKVQRNAKLEICLQSLIWKIKIEYQFSSSISHHWRKLNASIIPLLTPIWTIIIECQFHPTTDTNLNYKNWMSVSSHYWHQFEL